MLLCKEKTKEDYKKICLQLEYQLYKLEIILNKVKEENKHLDKVNCQLRKKINNDIYKSRNEKAIEYIEKNRDYWEEWHYDGVDINIEKDINNIENILQGEENEKNQI